MLRMWADANKTSLNQVPDEYDGWKKYDNSFTPIWFTGEQMSVELKPKEDDLTDEDNPEDVDIGSDSDSEQCSSDEEWEKISEKKIHSS